MTTYTTNPQDHHYRSETLFWFSMLPFVTRARPAPEQETAAQPVLSNPARPELLLWFEVIPSMNRSLAAR